ncbi:isoaspartyl peptidase/L-asparaginase-like [Nylanderia fulva]|uniref:isoaspartyl peptidase/L-asparaginase-like n=1 Tax=Nylanderia fulva TaxID=613905 RepID=UPI0010FB2AE6|nr:isoaspartyl peptidase/L-asparaginase-like [Nylanderia fulva]
MQYQYGNFNAPCILIHGSIGNFDDKLIVEKMTSCKKAASTGYQSLLNGASSIEAVETALWWLECDEIFNCGYGSVLNNIGNVQMDACIIDGFKLECGSVAAVSDIEHPISLARYVLHNFPNSIIVGEGAKKLVECAKLNLLSKGNMIAPAPYLAHKLEETGSCDIDLDIGDHCYAKLLESKLCIHYL